MVENSLIINMKIISLLIIFFLIFNINAEIINTDSTKGEIINTDSTKGVTIITDNNILPSTLQELYFKYDKKYFYSNKNYYNTNQCLIDCEARFTIYNPLLNDINIKDLTTNIPSVKVYILDTRIENQPTIYYKEVDTTCYFGHDKPTQQCRKNMSYIDQAGKPKTITFWNPEGIIKAGTTGYVKLEYKRKNLGEKSVEWIPKITLTNPEAGIKKVEIIEDKWDIWNNSWAKTMQIDINYSTLDLIDYPLLIHIPMYDGMEIGCTSLRCYNSSTDTLPHFIINYSSDECVADIRMNELRTNKLATIYCAYNNAEASDTSNGYDVMKIDYDTFPAGTLNQTIWGSCTHCEEGNGNVTIGGSANSPTTGLRLARNVVWTTPYLLIHYTVRSNGDNSTNNGEYIIGWTDAECAFSENFFTVDAEGFSSGDSQWNWRIRTSVDAGHMNFSAAHTMDGGVWYDRQLLLNKTTAILFSDSRYIGNETSELAKIFISGVDFTQSVRICSWANYGSPKAYHLDDFWVQETFYPDKEPAYTILENPPITTTTTTTTTTTNL